MSRGKHAALRELRRGRTLVVLTVLAMLVGLMAAVPGAMAAPGNAAYVSHTGTMYVPSTPHDAAIAAAVAIPDDGLFIQMGPNSSITMMFPGDTYAVPDGTSAADLRVDTYDEPYPAYAEVLLSLDGSAYTSVGFFADTANIDLDLVGPVKYVKLVQPETCDPSVLPSGWPDGLFCIDQDFPTLGFDLDAVVALNASSLGILSGTVTDATSGLAIDGATIDAVGSQTLSTTSEGSGDYEFPNISPGTFTVSVSAAGFMDQSVAGVTVLGGTTTTQDFALMPAATTAADCDSDEYFVSASGTGDDTPVVTTDHLVAGHEYEITARGVFYAGGNAIIADAEYSQDAAQRAANPSVDWTDLVNTYESYGEQLLELFVGVGGPPAPVEWGAYNSLHEYTIIRTGTGDPAEFQFQIYDIYAQNNTGGLCVSLQMLNRPPVADANGPYLVALGDPVTLDGTGSFDPDGDTLTFDWDFGDGSPGVVAGPMPTHTYATAGMYTVSLTVNDGYGATDTNTATVIVNTRPVADPNGWYLLPLEATFDGSGSYDEDGDPLTYFWEFGDGNTGTGVMPTHTYAAAGYYQVCLTVNDGYHDSDRRCTSATIYDGYVNGGGQILEVLDPTAKKIEQFKISFGGWLYRLGNGAPLCEWQVNFHNVSINSLDKGKFHGAVCTTPGRFNPGASDGVTNFAIYGTWNGDPGYTLVVRMEDNTEPGNLDTIRFELFLDPGMAITPGNSLSRPALYDTSDKAPAGHPGKDFVSISTNNGNARTALDNGNLQIYLP